ncbi:MAG: hypothetical protein QXT68_08675 [Halobacteria archaeon]
MKRLPLLAIAGAAALGLALALSASSTPCPKPGTEANTSSPVRVSYTPLERVVPAPNLPSGVAPQRSNNNLALALHEGRLFFAFRTAHWHFASPTATLYVLSSADLGRTWDLEAKIAPGRDVREPNFLSVNGSLLLYFFRGGVNPVAFEPGPTLVARRLGPGRWSEPAPLFPEEGWVAWRIKAENGTPYMLRYRGEHYNFSGGAKPLEVEFLTSRDGRNWTPVDPARPVVYSGGGSEADFGFDRSGDLLATIRIEDSDPGGMGARTCRAPAGDLANWACAPDPRRYDSPLALSHNGSVYLVARRHPLGPFDLGAQALPGSLQAALYNGFYWLTPKRTSLYRLVSDEPRAEWLLDFPSNGDTAFPALVKLNDSTYLLYNYSSDPEGCEVPWLAGQLGPTAIYATRLTLP